MNRALSFNSLSQHTICTSHVPSHYSEITMVKLAKTKRKAPRGETFPREITSFWSQLNTHLSFETREKSF